MVAIATVVVAAGITAATNIIATAAIVKRINTVATFSV